MFWLVDNREFETEYLPLMGKSTRISMQLCYGFKKCGHLFKDI
jgi:hypothetical protein